MKGYLPDHELASMQHDARLLEVPLSAIWMAESESQVLYGCNECLSYSAWYND